LESHHSFGLSIFVTEYDLPVQIKVDTLENLNNANQYILKDWNKNLPEIEVSTNIKAG